MILTKGLGRHGGKRSPGKSAGDPVTLDLRLDALVELDRRGVPIEHLPVDAGVTSVDRNRGQFGQQGTAVAEPAVVGLHVQILEVQPGRALPRRVALEEERHPDRRAGNLADDTFERRMVRFHLHPDGVRCGLDRVGLMEVSGFTRFGISGPKAAEWLDSLVINGNSCGTAEIDFVEVGGSESTSQMGWDNVKNVKWSSPDNGRYFVADSFSFGVEREMKESGEKGGTEDINIGVGELQECTVEENVDQVMKSWSTRGDADDRPTEEVAFYYNKIA